jgi:hypothetical protein
MSKALQWISVLIVCLMGGTVSPVRGAQCCGDCNSNGIVSID